MDEVSDTVAEKRLSLSDLLLTLAEGEAESVSVDTIVEHFGRRAFGAVLFIFSIPNLLPAAAVAALSLSLIQRDGLLTLIGYATTAFSVGVLVVSGRLVLAAFYRLEAMLGLL